MQKKGINAKKGRNAKKKAEMQKKAENARSILKFMQKNSCKKIHAKKFKQTRKYAKKVGGV